VSLVVFSSFKTTRFLNIELARATEYKLTKQSCVVLQRYKTQHFERSLIHPSVAMATVSAAQASGLYCTYVDECMKSFCK